MWEISNHNQVITFLLSVCLGALCCMLYDIIRAVRKVCFKSFLAVMVEDILLWIFYAFVTFIFLMSRTNGEIRGYALFGELFGFVLFRVSFSKLLFPIFSFIFMQSAAIKKRINTYFGVFYTKFESYILKMLKYVSKFFKSAKKLLKNALKLLYTNSNITKMEKSLNETKTEA